MFDIFIIGLPLIVGFGCFWIGIIIGKKSRKVPLVGNSAEEAFAFFALKEITRHREDIVNIKKDLRKLARRGIFPPVDVDLDLWLEVK